MKKKVKKKKKHSRQLTELIHNEENDSNRRDWPIKRILKKTGIELESMHFTDEQNLTGTSMSNQIDKWMIETKDWRFVA